MSGSAADCVLCGPLSAYEISALRHWRVVLNHNQDKLGKCMVCLKRHDEDVCNLSDEEVCELWDILRRLKAALVSAFQPDHFNYAFLMNQDPHVHMHVIPRYRSRRTFAGSGFQDIDETTSRKLPENAERELVRILTDAMEACSG